MFKKLKSLFHTAEAIVEQSKEPSAPASTGNVQREIERLSRSAQQFETEEDWQGAADLYRRLYKLEPDNIRWLKDEGFVLSEDEDWDASISVYEQVLEQLPEDANAFCNIGRMRLEQMQLQVAEQALQEALTLDADHVQALFYMGMVHQKLRRYPESLELFARSADRDPNFHFAWFNAAISHVAMGDHEQAAEALRRCREILHGDGVQLPVAMPPHKFVHDAEQLAWLAENGHEGISGVAEDWRGMVDSHELQTLRDSEAWLQGQLVIDEKSPAGVQHAAFQPLIRHEEPRLERVLNPDLDFAAIEAEFFEGPLPVVAIDSVMTAEALQAVRRFCRSNTFWYNLKPGYLGAYLQDGFYCPLLFQLAIEMKEALPRILGGHVWRNMWGYSHDRHHGGIKLHADTAAVNVNYWLSPDAANLQPESGGLLVWDKTPPVDWNFRKLNTDEAAIRDFLDSSGARPVRFPFRKNRALVFRSDLFHRTDDIDFAEGFENRRLNLTMLYGQREDITSP